MLIHGLVGSLRYFDPQARLPQVEIVADDLLGYGRFTDTPAGQLTLAAQAEHVARQLDRQPAERVWLLGHSMGGAVAVLAADRRPERVCGLISVEGNLTEQDCFWSRRIAAKTPAQWAADYAAMQADPAGWLERCGIAPTPRRVSWARHLLTHQPAATVYAMAGALLNETLCPGYLGAVRRLLQRGLPLHLVAGARSAGEWGVPDFVRTAAASYHEQPDVGHLMMLEDPDGFCRIIGAIVCPPRPAEG